MSAWFTLKHLESRLPPTAPFQQCCEVHICYNCGQSHQLDERVYRFANLIRLLHLDPQCPHCGSTAVQLAGWVRH